MPRQISNLLQAMLDGDTQTLAICALLKRTDGTEFGFTTNTSKLILDGIVTEFLPNDGIFPTVLESTAGTGVDNMDWSGILSDGRITLEDIERGKYQNAFVTLFIVDYTDPEVYDILTTGTIGEIAATDTKGIYTVTLNGRSRLTSKSIGETTSLSCRAPIFGSAPCNISLTGKQFTVNVTTNNADEITYTFSSGLTSPSGSFNEGTIESLSGANDGLVREIKTHTYSSGVSTIVLHEPFPDPLEVGSSVKLTFGCDRTWERCLALGNWKNFQAEPFLPRGKEMESYGKY